MAEEIIPKSEWGPGPWQDEPDKLEWIDDETGYQCLIKRNPFTGALCGYVGLSEGHPYYGKKYSDRIPLDDAPGMSPDMESVGGIPLLIELWKTAAGPDGRVSLDVIIRVHGSVTFTGFWEDREDGLWYFGFDTGHYMDYMPGLVASTERHLGRTSCLRHQDCVYRTISYVQDQCRQLAQQLKAVAVDSQEFHSQ